MYEQLREEINMYDIGTSLGPNPNNGINTKEFFKTTQILKL